MGTTIMHRMYRQGFCCVAGPGYVSLCCIFLQRKTIFYNVLLNYDFFFFFFFFGKAVKVTSSPRLILLLNYEKKITYSYSQSVHNYLY